MLFLYVNSKYFLYYIYINHLKIKIMNTEHRILKEGLHLGFEIAKLTFKAAAIVAAFLTVREIHNIHKSLESHKLLK